MSVRRPGEHGWWGTNLGDCLVVDVDEFTGVRVDLQCAVEAQRGLDVVCAYTN
jgi:hypothetical protein